MSAVGLRAEPVGALFDGNETKDSLGCSLNRPHWHVAADPRVPNTAWRCSQLASLAGMIVSSGVVVASAMWTP